MYISRVEIDTNNRQKMKDLTHLGAYHNWVEQSFPDELERNERSRKLWRIDRYYNKQYLLVVSSIEPNLSLLERYGVEGTASTKLYDTFLDSLEDGMKLRFKVTLNPVVSIPRKGHKRGRVVPHVTYDNQMTFLQERSQKNGFILQEDGFFITERSTERLKKSGSKDIRLSRTTYEGVLQIDDASLFKSTLTKGFGKKKAYGFGLMTVIPLE